MAKILFTAIVADMRNKLAGTVFSKNRYGAYARTKVTPVNPDTTAQANVRASFAEHSQAWRGLTDEQRQSWIDAAPSFPVFDIFGNSKVLSGSALYSKLNLNLSAIGNSSISTAPSPVAIEAMTSLAITADVSDSEIDVAATPEEVPAGFKAIIQATPLYSPGKAYVKNLYRQIAVVPATGTLNATNIFSDWTAKFGPLVAGQKLSVRIFFVNETTGQSGIAVSATTTVVA